MWVLGRPGRTRFIAAAIGVHARLRVVARDSSPARGATVCLLVLAAALSAACSAAIDPLAIEDARTAARVKTAIVNDAQVGPRPIEVRVEQGVAYLSGIVETAAEAERAVDLARAVAGVRAVRSTLRVDPAPPPAPSLARRRSGEADLLAPDDPRLLALGGSLAWVAPRPGRLEGVGGLGPLARFGSGRGLAPAIDFNWFSADLFASSRRADRLGRMHVRPVMAGLGYTVGTIRVSISLSLVGGIAFNSFDPDDTTAEREVALKVNRSLAWRPGVSVWYDASRRLALHVFGGYIVVHPGVTYFADGRLDTRVERANTVLVSTGIAWKIF